MRMGLNKKLVVISSPYPWYTFNVIADSESEKFKGASEGWYLSKFLKHFVIYGQKWDWYFCCD